METTAPRRTVPRMSAATDTTTPRAWVGCLGCYNAGRLVGKWVDGTEAGDVTPADLGLTPTIYDSHDELWVMDHEGYGRALTGECSPVEAQRRAELIAAIEEEHYPAGAVFAWAELTGADLEEWDARTRELFEDCYHGEWPSFRDYAEDFAESTGAVDEEARWPHSYIDWDRAADELEQGYWTAEADGGGVYVFHH